jgi:hypothetical protein
MEELVPTDSIVHYLNENRPAAINAGVLSAAEQKLVKLGGAALDKDGNLVPGKMSINDVEEVRKFVSKTAGKDPTNMHFGDELKTAIDASTEGKGGELYKQARALHRQTAQEFKNTGVVAKLLRDKPGTTDRAVALEDVFKHSVMSSSNEDLRALRRTLQTQGEDGKQAWRELQGETVRQIKESVTANASLDERGNPIVSPAKFKRVVDELDKDEKLEILFGKKGAQQLRDLRDTAMDVSTKVPGSVNFSGTGSYLMRALDAMHLLHIPYAGKVAAAVAERSIKNEKKAAVAHALGETPKQKLLKDHQDSNPVAPRKMTGTDE